MIDVSAADVRKLITHKVGNRSRDEGLVLSPVEGDPGSAAASLLLRHYVLPLAKQDQVMDFRHDSDIRLNDLRAFTQAIFNDSETFGEQSRNIARHLYSVSSHANITGGELIVALVSNIKVSGETADGLAVLRMENVTDYLQFAENAGQLFMQASTGVSLAKVQRGLLVLSNDLQIRVIDNLGNRTKYWNDDFIHCVPRLTDSVAIHTGVSLIRRLAASGQNAAEKSAIVQAVAVGLQQDEKTTLQSISKSVSTVLPSERITKVLNDVRLRTGVSVPDELEMDAELITKKSRSTINKRELMPGITLTVSNPGTVVESAEVRHEGGHEIITVKVTRMEDRSGGTF